MALKGIAAEGTSTAVQASAGAHAHGERVFSLTVISGADKGRSFLVDAQRATRILVGKSEICEIRLTDKEVSRRHAAFEATGTALRVFDLDSTNGTYVDRVRIYCADLVGGELVRVGTTVLRVDDRAEEPSRPLSSDTSFGRLLGGSKEMRRLYPLCAALAKSAVPVVLEGATGTGKEVLAEAIHEQGARAKGPFVVFDCTVVSSNLAESELFGHERGAFTGAVAARKGVFEQADGGTLLIDEIGDLDPSLQSKLLRAIERSEVRRVGGNAWLKVDVRVLAATRRDLDREVEAGRFRDDLFHRLAVGRIELPPLRDRKGDVTFLASRFWESLGGAKEALVPGVLRRWEEAPWPGNVRELRNAVARLLALGEPDEPARSPLARVSNDADIIGSLISAGVPFPKARDQLLEIFTERYVESVLVKHGGDVPAAAASSGIGRRYFEKLRARTVGK